MFSSPGNESWEVDRAGEQSLGSTSSPYQLPPALTLWLLLVGGDGSHEVLRGHEHLGLAVLVDDLQRGKVPEDFVWCGVGSDPVLIFHHLEVKFSQH